MKHNQFSQGIEKIIGLAALDKVFRKQLLSNRKTALDKSEVSLSDSEQEILLNIPDKQLHQAIINARVPEPARRAFLAGSSRAIVTALVVAGGIFVLSAISIGSTSERAGEVNATLDLRYIARIQQEYKAKLGRYAPTLRDLPEKGFPTHGIASGEKTGYKYIYSNATETSWQLRALPLNSGKKLHSFFIDQTGTLRYSKTRDVGPESPEFRK